MEAKDATGAISPGRGLFSDRECAWLILGWLAFWWLGHHLFWSVWNCRHFAALLFSGRPVDKYRKRLCRSQVYCVIAVVVGVQLLIAGGLNPQALLFAFTQEHQVFFSMAVAHWLISVWEDMTCWTFLRAGLAAKDVETPGVGEPSQFLLRAYVVHHVTAAVAFAIVLFLHACTGIGLFGLIFELPVLLMNHREFCVCADSPPTWFRDFMSIDSFWRTLTLFFVLGRGGPSLVYIYSIFFWSDDLQRLPSEEQFFFHFMSIFFTVLNYLLINTFLAAWSKKDLGLARLKDEEEQQPTDCETGSEMTAPQQESSSSPPPEAVDPEKAAKYMLKTHPADVLKIISESEEYSGQVWFEIDSILYNVTDFLDTHPGGGAVLRKFAGKDASQAFQKVKHSMRAKMMMQRYCEGPIMKPPTSYRIFEHMQEFRGIQTAVLQLATYNGLTALLLPYTAISSANNAIASKYVEGVLDPLVFVPGLVFSATAGSGLFFLLMCGGQLKFRLMSVNVVLVTVSVILHFVSLTIARKVPSPDIPSTAPTGLEMGVFFLYVLEELSELMRRPRPRIWRFRLLLAPTLTILSWVLRGLEAVARKSPEQILAGIGLGLSVSMVARRVLSDKPKQVVASEVLLGFGLVGPVSVLMLRLLADSTPEVSGIVWTVWSTSSLYRFFTFVLATGGSFAFTQILHEAHGRSPYWCARLVAVYWALAVWSAGGFSNWRWLCVIAWFSHNLVLGRRNQEEMEAATAAGTFGQIGAWKIGTRSAWDLFRISLMSLIWNFLARFIRFLVNTFTPKELTFYLSVIPIFDFGADVDLGVAVYYSSEKAVQSHTAPDHFVCSVSHMDRAHAHGPQDLCVSRNFSKETWFELSHHTQGLAAAVFCFFPRVLGSSRSKEVLITCWESKQEADNFFSMDTFKAQEQRSQHELATKATVTFDLKLHGKIRHQDRCKVCLRLVESDNMGEKAPTHCRHCGGKTNGYPFF